MTVLHVCLTAALTASRAQCIAAASDVEFSQTRWDVVTDTFTCYQNDQVPLYVQACKCQHDTKALCKMYKWQVAYHVKTKAVPGLCFRTWYAKKLKTKKRIKKRVWVCIFTRDFLSLCTHNTNTYGHAQWFTIISGASSMKRSATVQERRQGVVLRSVNIASVYSSQLIWWTLITLLC